METAITREIHKNIFFRPQIKHNVFGSSYEGKTSPGMTSDMDQVFVFNDPSVVNDPADYPVGTCLLLVQDQTTPPGYCKLQVVHNGNPL